LDANNHQKKNPCTSQPCYWLHPTFKNVPFAKICDRDFSSATRKHRDLLSGESVDPSVVPAASATHLAPSFSEIDLFYHNLSEAGSKLVILSLVPGFCDTYLPSQLQAKYPILIMNLYEEEYLSLSYPVY